MQRSEISMINTCLSSAVQLAWASFVLRPTAVMKLYSRISDGASSSSNGNSSRLRTNSYLGLNRWSDRLTIATMSKKSDRHSVLESLDSCLLANHSTTGQLSFSSVQFRNDLSDKRHYKENNGASRRMSHTNVRVGFLKQKCFESTPEGWQRQRRNNVFGQLVPNKGGPETLKTRLPTVDSLKVGTTKLLHGCPI